MNNETREWYKKLRALHPNIRACEVFQYMNSEGFYTLPQFACGHVWEYMDSGRCYCAKCGADGEA